MSDEQIEELLRLSRENNALLQPKGRGHVTSDDIMRFINEMKM